MCKIMNSLIKILPKLALVLVFMVFLTTGLLAQFNTDFSKTEISTWFYFEPNEEFVIEGSTLFLDNASHVKYYPSVAGFFSFFDNSENSLGIRASWDRAGSHFVDIVPKSVLENPETFPVGELHSISLWVWGGNYNHELAVILKRRDGYAYSLKLTKLNFRGWKKIKVNVPLSVRVKINPKDSIEKYFFDRFRVYTAPNEKVGDVYVFLDVMDVSRDFYAGFYDGVELSDVIRQEKLENKRRSATDNSSGN